MELNNPMEPKRLTYDFLGEEVIFQERSTRDVFRYMSYADSDEDEDSNADIYIKNLALACLVITDSLKYYISTLSYWKRRKATRKFSRQSIMSRMSPIKIIEMSNLLLEELEGVKIAKPGDVELKDTVKKKIPNLSPKQSQSPSSQQPTGSH